MVKLRYLFLCLLLGFSTPAAFGQSELSIEDMDNDGDVIIELKAPSSTEIELRHMLLGVNQSSEGFLRMLSDNDLSFWTNSQKRMTLKNNGFIGIGTNNPHAKLQIQNGGLIVETITKIVGGLGLQESNIDFYTDNTKVAGFQYRGNALTMENSGIGDIKFKTNEETRMTIKGNGAIQVPDFSGSGERDIVVDSSGFLKIKTETDIHMMIPVNYFQPMFSTIIFNNFGGSIYAPGVFPHFNLEGMQVAPMFPYTKVLVTQVEIFYIDNKTGTDIEFRLREPNTSAAIFMTSAGSSELKRSIIYNLSTIVDQSLNEILNILIFGAVNDDLKILGAKVIYSKL